MAFDRAARHLNVFKRHCVIGKLLIIFVTFARDQHDVTRLSELDCARNRRRAVGDFFKLAAAKAFLDLGDDLVRIFVARIILSDDRVIGILIGHCSHERSFFTITIAAAAENDN